MMGCLKSLIWLVGLGAAFFGIGYIVLGPEPPYISENPYTCEGKDNQLEDEKSLDTTITLNGETIGWSTKRPGKENLEELFDLGGRNERSILYYPDYITVNYDVKREPNSNIISIISRNINQKDHDNELWGKNYEVNIGRCTVEETDTIPFFRKNT